MKSRMKNEFLIIAIVLFAIGLAAASVAHSATMEISIEVPALQANPYHKPYVAVWLETPERKAITTLAIWHERDTWLKDLRQWWRKVGRNAGAELDGVTGATRKPGRYRIQWDGKSSGGQPVPAGEYFLNIEASREEGGRSYHREKITLGQMATLTIPAQTELGEISITIEGKQ